MFGSGDLPSIDPAWRNLSSPVRHILKILAVQDRLLGDGFVDPRHGGQLGRLGPTVTEPGRVGLVGGGQCVGPSNTHLARGAEVDRGGRVITDARVAVLVAVVGEKLGTNVRASWMEPKRSGKSGQYLRVLNCDSENGLILL